MSHQTHPRGDSEKLLYEQLSWRMRGRQPSCDSLDQANALLLPFLHTLHCSLLSPALSAAKRHGAAEEEPPTDPSKPARQAPTAFLRAKPAEAARGDSDEQTCREGLLPYGEEVREKE